MMNKMTKIIVCTFLTGIILVPIMNSINPNVNGSVFAPFSIEDPEQMR